MCDGGLRPLDAVAVPDVARQMKEGGFAIQESGTATQVRGTAGRRQDFERDVRGVESRDRRKDTARTREASSVDAGTQDGEEAMSAVNATGERETDARRAIVRQLFVAGATVE